jgi:hypothetical protein
MDKVGPDIVAVEVHAGTAHMKRVVSTPGPADVLGFHFVIFRYSDIRFRPANIRFDKDQLT